MPKVRVVTPTDPQTDTIKAFKTELMAKVKNSANLDYRVYSAADDNGNLDAVVQYAVDDKPDAILACGTMAAAKLQDKPLKIVMVGGGPPPNLQPTVTGFTIDTVNGVAVAQHHLDQLTAAPNVQKITVLYDDTNDPSRVIFHALDDSQGKIEALPISDPGAFRAKNIATEGFMLIPNAMYYSHRKHIIGMLDNSNSVKAIYFPEREYKDKSSTQTKAKASVFGHDLPATFKDAADIVASILNDSKFQLPQLREGQRPYSDEPHGQGSQRSK